MKNDKCRERQCDRRLTYFGEFGAVTWKEVEMRKKPKDE